MLSVTSKALANPNSTLEFDDTKQIIKFGRRASSDVAFPEELTVVGHDHFELKREAGGYKFVINSLHRVFIDGKDVLNETELKKAKEVRLGSHDGPSLLLEPRQKSDPGSLGTIGNGQGVEIADVVRSSQHWLHLIAPALILLIVVAGYAWYQYRSDTRDLSHEIGLIAHAGNFSKLLAKQEHSVFLVEEIDAGGNAQSSATAWVVAMPDGSKAFATNAHVAQLFYDAQAHNNTLVVRSPEKDHRQYLITAVRVHPAFAAFDKLIKETYAKSQAGGLIKAMELAPSYDVALLIPETQAELPEALEIASDRELADIHSGQPLAMIGYPKEGLIVSDDSAPSTTYEVGIVTSVRSFFLTSDTGDLQLIEHSIPATGGASGSPIFNENGHVIGLLNGGNVVEIEPGKRHPNAAMINFAQRVDLLQEVIHDTAAAHLAIYQDQWKTALARWSRKPAQVATGYLSAFQNEFGATRSLDFAGTTVTTAANLPPQSSPQPGNVSGGGGGGAVTQPQPAKLQSFSSSQKELPLLENTPYLLTVETNRADGIDIVVVDNAQTGAEKDTTLVTKSPLAVVYFPAGAARTVQIDILSYDTDTSGQATPHPVSYKAKLYSPVNPRP